MAGNKNSKLKLLYLKEIFEKYTDEDNILNSNEIASLLNNHGIECERKSIYKDIEILIEYGMDIIKTTVPKKGYFLASRDFELAEIRLLNDAVQAAQFISKKKTQELIKKTDSLLSVAQASRLKSEKKVKLIYNRRKLDNKFTAANEQKEFTLSPYALIWSNDHYYLVANNGKYDNLMNMRIDRIRKVEILEESFRHFSEVSEYTTTFDSADYSSKTFNMFSGKPHSTELRCKTEILEEMLDRFGEKVSIRKGEDDWFFIHDDLYLNDGLVSWIMQFGNKIQVVYPIELKRMIFEKAKSIIDTY